MGTIILSVGGCGCGAWESEIRDAILEITGEEDAKVEVYGDTDRVVVHGGNARAGELQVQLYMKLALRATVVAETNAPPEFEFSSSVYSSDSDSDSDYDSDDEN